MKEKLLRPLLFAAFVVAMVAPATVNAQGWHRYHEGYVIQINPGYRRMWHHNHWVYMHRHRWHGNWVWR